MIKALFGVHDQKLVYRIAFSAQDFDAVGTYNACQFYATDKCANLAFDAASTELERHEA